MLNNFLRNSGKLLCFFLLNLYAHAVFASAGKIAIIIDDMGYNHHNKDFLTLPQSVTFAILPFTPFAQKLAHAAHQQHRDVILHMPMQAHSHNHLLGDGALMNNMTKPELEQAVNLALSQLPYAIGVNSHMGSQLTESEPPMQWIMQLLFKRGLFFIDSLTTSKSVAEKQAIQAGLPGLKRSVFLDNVRTSVAMEKQFQQAIKHSHNNNTIIIAHPYPETLTFLSQRLAKPSESFQLVTLSQLITDQQQALLKTQRIKYEQSNHQDLK